MKKIIALGLSAFLMGCASFGRVQYDELGCPIPTHKNSVAMLGWFKILGSIAHQAAMQKTTPQTTKPVSYTHLTLPTKRIV